MELFEEYQSYVFARVIKELHGYTILRAGLELAEEFLEFQLAVDEDGIEELGDLFFWFAYLSRVSGFEFKAEFLEEPKDPLFLSMELIKNIIGCVKRFYRDNNAEKLIEMRDKHFPDFIYYLCENAKYLDISLDELMIRNVAKLDSRFGEPIPESLPFINR